MLCSSDWHVTSAGPSLRSLAPVGPVHGTMLGASCCLRGVRPGIRASSRARHAVTRAAASAPAEPLLAQMTPTRGGVPVRDDFPILRQEVGGGPLVYLDSAATSQKPIQVLRAMEDYYERYNSNVHRGVHTLSALATEEYEAARAKVARLVGAPRSDEIVFTRNATEAINLVAHTWATPANLAPGDEIVLTVAEHHSNLVPWQMAAQRTGAMLRFAGLRQLPPSVGAEAGNVGGEGVDYEQLLDLISPRTRLVAIHHISNVLGSEAPVRAVVERAQAVGARVLLDACQSVPHCAVDITSLGVDFLVASSHKMLGPTGIGFLHAPYGLLASLPPFLGGGEMITDVFLDHSEYALPPARFEAGTPAIAEAVGLGAACDYLAQVDGGMDALHQFEMGLTAHLYRSLASVPGVRIYGPPPPAARVAEGGSAAGTPSPGRAAALCAFNVEGIHPTDLATFLDQQHGVAIRSGHHCAQPLHRSLGISSTARASLHCYNTSQEVDAFIAALRDCIDFFGV